MPNAFIAAVIGSRGSVDAGVWGYDLTDVELQR